MIDPESAIESIGAQIAGIEEHSAKRKIRSEGGSIDSHNDYESRMVLKSSNEADAPSDASDSESVRIGNTYVMHD
jgi:hypothetical protein